MNNPFKVDKVAEATEDAKVTYQIKEKDGELWITYDSAPVIPESLLKKPALETLQELRELYVKSKNVIKNEA